MEVKIDETSIQKWNQDGKASWHRFLVDFGGFLEASWERPPEDAPRMADLGSIVQSEIHQHHSKNRPQAKDETHKQTTTQTNH